MSEYACVNSVPCIPTLLRFHVKEVGKLGLSYRLKKIGGAWEDRIFMLEEEEISSVDYYSLVLSSVINYGLV